MNSDDKYYKQYLKELVDQFDLGAPKYWSKSEYKQAQQIIKEKTGEQVSESTLWRIFSKRNHQPYISTKNVLARFLGYKNWADYIAKAESRDEHISHHEEKRKLDKGKVVFDKGIQKNRYKWWLVIAIVILLLFVIWMVFRNNNVQPETKVDLFQISSDDTLSFVPITAIFNFKWQADIHDSVRIEFGNYKEEIIPPGVRQYSHKYASPDYYNVKCYMNQRLVDSIKMHMLTKEWFLSVFVPKEDKREKLKIHQEELFVDDGIMHPSTDLVYKMGIDTNRLYFSEFRYVNDFYVQADHMTIETRLKNNVNFPVIRNNDVMIFFRTHHGLNQIHISAPCCHGGNMQVISEQRIGGRHSDNSVFGRDISDWVNIKLSIVDFVANIYFNGYLIKEIPYEKEMGQLKAVYILFRGSGSVDYFRIRNNETNAYVLNDDFNR